jgi:outer membrane autotransporter protein
MGAAAAAFRTEEYIKGNGLDGVNAAAAYELGYSGKGVTVGILDCAFFKDHPEFSSKVSNGGYVEKIFVVDGDDWHGVHVTGTIAAALNREGMHGVAYDADVFTLVALGTPTAEYAGKDAADEALKFLVGYGTFIPIVNNSWAQNGGHLESYAGWGTQFIGALEATATPMAALAERGTLLVFSSGNEGTSSSGLPSALPTLVTGASLIGGGFGDYEDNVLNNFAIPDDNLLALSRNMINVAAFDPETYNPTDAAATTARIDFIPSFSNTSNGSAHYTLLAPGVDIYSSVGPPDFYEKISGTSMAAPHVSGVAALVKEAFPWMDGKQLADTLLSTAAHLNDLGGLPPFLIQLPEDSSGDYMVSVTIPDTFIEDEGYDLDDVLGGTQLLSGIIADYGEQIGRLLETSDVKNIPFDEFTGAIETALDNPDRNRDPAELWAPADHGKLYNVHVVTDDEYLSLFGMGVVNAGAAVRGPAWLDANRMNDEDLAEYAFGSDAVKQYAIYEVDTSGYSSVWYNGVGQVKTTDTNYPVAATGGIGAPTPSHDPFNRGLDGLDVGLRMTGAGKLTLAGANTYLGPTIVDKGEIALGRTGMADGAASLAGDVAVSDGAAFSGNGLVKGNLTSSGTLAPGLPDAPGSSLTVGKNVENSGVIRVTILRDGTSNRLVVGGNADVSGTAVELSNLAGGAMPSGSFDIVTADTFSGTLAPASLTATAQQGVTLLHTYALGVSGQALQAKLAGSSALPGAKALSEGFLAGTALVNQAADLAAGQGIAEAVKAATAGAGGGTGFGAFGAASIGRIRNNTGSHVDLSSLSLTAGLSRGAETGAGRLTLGAFFEYGNGSYDTYNSFGNAASVRGEGDIRHFGGGALARMDFNDSGTGRFYAELSGRAGQVRNEYSSADLRDPVTGRAARYESSVPYYGIHAALGFVCNVSDRASFDLSGKYFWTRQKGDSLTLSTGDPVRFDDADSSRVRLGARISYAANDCASPYAGAAWEREFGGAARAAANGVPIDAPSLRGDTGVGELGLTLRPSPSLPLFFDLGVQGYTGKREGATGGFQARVEF